MRGVNHTHWWGGTGEDAIVPMAKAGANAVRAVFGPSGGASTPDARAAIARQYVAQGVVPVVDYHNATCSEDPAGVSAAVDFWTGPDKAWVQSLERYTILNITNEWGPNSPVYRDTYVAAIERLRAAGIKNTLMIDAGGACGQLADSIESYGRAIFDSDPEKNVVFSIHMYGFWRDPGDPGGRLLGPRSATLRSRQGAHPARRHWPSHRGRRVQLGALPRRHLHVACRGRRPTRSTAWAGWPGCGSTRASRR